MKRLSTLLLFFCCVQSWLGAQDKEFTQFYASPLTLNPALTGAFEGRYRVGTIYRDQWRKVLDYPIRTFALAADLRFDAPGKSVRDDALGLGLMFFTDRVSVVDFNTTQIALSMAYHKSLDAANTQYLTLGLQGGLTQRNVNYESLDFQDEFDGVNSFNGGTGEGLPANNFAFTDWNAGLNYSAKIGRAGGLYAGLALHHFLEPQVSFFENNEEGDKLYMKMSGQLAANIPIGSSKVSVLPRFLFAKQGPHIQVNTGANLRFNLGEGGIAMHLGSWVRPVRNDTGFGVDAVVALAGIEFSNVLVGLSYDLNLGALQYSQRQGAFEISIAYLGNYDNEEIMCPKF